MFLFILTFDEITFQKYSVFELLEKMMLMEAAISLSMDWFKWQKTKFRNGISTSLKSSYFNRPKQNKLSDKNTDLYRPNSIELD